MRRRHLLPLLLAACSSPSSQTPSGMDPTATDTPDAPATVGDPVLQLCVVADASNLDTTFTRQAGADWVSYACVTPCNDWTQCHVDAYTDSGMPAISQRDNSREQLLAFVVDGMAGHFVYTTDGGDVVVTHAGVGGTTLLNGAFDHALQMHSTIKTVSLGWMPGTDQAFGGAAGGWFTRKDGNPSSVRAQAARPAAALQWVKDHFAQGKKLGTVGESMGTVATLGAHVWHGLEPILDYQMLIGGPGLWDINAGCGRIHISAGHCDADASPCTGNPNSSYGDDDPACGSGGTNECRVPTIMAPLAGGQSNFDLLINYVGATTACAPTPTDDRDATLDDSSLFTLTDWSFHGRIDIVTDEGGTQPPNADQGMGEGHMLYLYNALTGPKSWTDHDGYHHGDSWTKVATLVEENAARVIAAMEE